MDKILGPCSGTAWEGQTGERKHREFPSRLQSLLATISTLEENILPLLLYLLTSRANKVLIICKFGAATSHFSFFVQNEIFNGIGKKLLLIKAAPNGAHCFAPSFNQSLVSE